MAEFPYTTVPGKIEKLLSTIQNVGVPTTSVDKQWLIRVGFTDSNDPTLLRILEFLGFIDDDGIPTNRWNEYRDKSRASRALATALIDAYADLFHLYTDANIRNREELGNFFRATTDKGKRAVDGMIATFLNLCALADFTEASPGPSPSPAPLQSEILEKTKPQQMDVIQAPLAPEFPSGMTINVNIQLTVPATTDKDVYDEFFAAMKRHLLG